MPRKEVSEFLKLAQQLDLRDQRHAREGMQSPQITRLTQIAAQIIVRLSSGKSLNQPDRAQSLLA